MQPDLGADISVLLKLTMVLFICMQVKTGGEDAFFVSPCGAGAVAVADGVGGWAEDGVDAAEYAQQLMNRCAEVSGSTDVCLPEQL